MSTRAVISYDDITLPYDPVNEGEPTTQPSPRAEQPPPAKRRKKNNQRGKNRANPSRSNGSAHHNQYTNGSASTSSRLPLPQQEEYDESMQDEEGYYEEEESRELTHQEIWDDSALVYAWEAAVEEYEAFHGPDKDWKKEPVKKSPLWYNVPPDPSKKSSNASSGSKAPTAVSIFAGPDAATTHNDEEEHDSKPLDFDTFMPTHDPSLYPSSGPVDSVTAQAPQMNYVPDGAGDGAMVSQDEAFQRALSAMYWGGYWTAMYHAQRQLSQSQGLSTLQTSPEDQDDGDAEEASEGGEEIQVDNEDGLVSTQR